MEGARRTSRRCDDLCPPTRDAACTQTEQRYTGDARDWWDVHLTSFRSPSGVLSLSLRLTRATIRAASDDECALRVLISQWLLSDFDIRLINDTASEGGFRFSLRYETVSSSIARIWLSFSGGDEALVRKDIINLGGDVTSHHYEGESGAERKVREDNTKNGSVALFKGNGCYELRFTDGTLLFVGRQGRVMRKETLTGTDYYDSYGRVVRTLA